MLRRIDTPPPDMHAYLGAIFPFDLGRRHGEHLPYLVRNGRVAILVLEKST